MWKINKDELEHFRAKLETEMSARGVAHSGASLVEEHSVGPRREPASISAHEQAEMSQDDGETDATDQLDDRALFSGRVGQVASSISDLGTLEEKLGGKRTSNKWFKFKWFR